MQSDVLEPPGAIRAIAEVSPSPRYPSFADVVPDQELSPAREIVKAIMISLPFWLLVGLGVWAF